MCACQVSARATARRPPTTQPNNPAAPGCHRLALSQPRCLHASQQTPLAPHPSHPRQASPEVKAALTKSMKAGLDRIMRRAKNISPVRNGWQMNTEGVGVYGALLPVGHIQRRHGRGGRRGEAECAQEGR